MTLVRGKCTQLQAVRWLLGDGEWWTLERLTRATRDFVGASEAAVSARIRDLRKEGLAIELEPLRRGSRQFKYRLVLGGGECESQPTKETRALETSPPDFSSPQQLTLGGGGFASTQEPAPAFSQEYPD